MRVKSWKALYMSVAVVTALVGGLTATAASAPVAAQTVTRVASTTDTGRVSPGIPDQAPDVRSLFDELGKKWPGNRTVNMVFHGHSVPSGYHLTPAVKPFESYPFMVYQGMSARFSTAVMNCITTSIGGENSVQGAKRFRRDVLPHRPDLLFIDYAINDRSLPLDDVENAWRSMIETARRAHVVVVLLTPTGTRFNDLSSPTDALSVRAELLRRLGAEYDIPVADVSARWQDALDSGTPQESLLSQGVHPNKAGHEIAAAEILRTLDAMRASARQPAA